MRFLRFQRRLRLFLLEGTHIFGFNIQGILEFRWINLITVHCIQNGDEACFRSRALRSHYARQSDRVTIPGDCLNVRPRTSHMISITYNTQKFTTFSFSQACFDRSVLLRRSQSRKLSPISPSGPSTVNLKSAFHYKVKTLMRAKHIVCGKNFWRIHFRAGFAGE